jgi:outer membrane protein TolC
VLALAAARPAASLGQQPAPTVLTLEQAIELALRDNRLVKNSQLAVAKVEDQLAATHALRRPAFKVYALGAQQLAELNFEFERGAYGTYAATGPVPARRTVLSTPRRPTLFIVGSVTQPLSQQYRIGLNLDQLGLSREVAGEGLRRQQQAVVGEAKQLYYGILQSQSALRSLEQSVRLYRELDRVTGEYVTQRLALKAQNLEVKTRLAKTEYEVLGAGNKLASQKEQLNSLLGRDIRTEFEVSPAAAPEGFETDLAEAQKRALERRPEVKEARLKLRQAVLDRRIKKSERIPDVSVSLNYLSPRNFDPFVPKNLLSVGFALSWDVFDWGRRGHELGEKSKTSEQARNAVLETENRILTEVNGRFRGLQQTRQLLRVAQLAQETARENLRVAENKFRVERALLSDVLQAQTSVAEADNQYQQALLAFWTAKADYEKALGEDK